MIQYLKTMLNLGVTSWVLMAIGCVGIQGTVTRQVQRDPQARQSNVSSRAHKEEDADSEDHPLIPGFPGATIVYHEQVEFGEYVLPLDGLDDERNLSESRKIAGKITRIQYRIPENLSTFEVYRSYESTLKEKGFEILFSGTNEDLSWRWTYILYEHGSGVNSLPADVLEKNLLVSENDFRYLSAELRRVEEENVFVALTVSQTQAADGPGVQLDIIEEKSME